MSEETPSRQAAPRLVFGNTSAPSVLLLDIAIPAPLRKAIAQYLAKAALAIYELQHSVDDEDAKPQPLPSEPQFCAAIMCGSSAPWNAMPDVQSAVRYQLLASDDDGTNVAEMDTENEKQRHSCACFTLKRDDDEDTSSLTLCQHVEQWLGMVVDRSDRVVACQAFDVMVKARVALTPQQEPLRPSALETHSFRPAMQQRDGSDSNDSILAIAILVFVVFFVLSLVSFAAFYRTSMQDGSDWSIHHVQDAVYRWLYPAAQLVDRVANTLSSIYAPLFGFDPPKSQASSNPR